MENLLKKIQRVVIKIGTAGITTDHSINVDAIRNLAKAAYDLKKAGKDVAIVTSGAVGAGRIRRNDWISQGIREKQVFAGIGQPLLISEYIRIFGQKRYGDMVVKQIVLGKKDFIDPTSFHALNGGFLKAFEWGVVPIFNENDPIITYELKRSEKLSDNDQLEALIATRLKMDLAVNLITRPGLLRGGRVVEIGDSYDAGSYDDLSDKNRRGTGGMQGKLSAVRMMNRYGVPVIIGNGDILGMIKGTKVQTRFMPRGYLSSG